MTDLDDGRSFAKPTQRAPAVILVALLTLLQSAPAGAAERIGVAAHVRNKVTGKIQAEVVDINQGADVFGREVIKTLPDSLAKLVLKDDTNLSVGPNSSVTLDDFVYAGPADFKKATFNMAKGTLRFSSGASDQRSYQVRTPNATIGVRG